MKTILHILFVLSLGLSLSGCRTANRRNIAPLAESMKGYELYSWKEGNRWVFSLLVGTNRKKALDEIKSKETILPDVGALISMLEKVPSGQYITWSSRETLAFPPDNVIKQVEQICNDKGLILNIAK